jgi:adenine-specific DNA-methyltransferase
METFMKVTNKFEKQFFTALNDIFVGAKVEGDSGFVNLMRIKSRYYEQGVFPQLQKDINAALQPFPDFREELFDKLYTFFQRYFSESGSIYFRYTPLHQNVYEKVYTDDRDVILFWKTHMLYYVKTDRIFTSLNVEVDGVKFFFDASKMTLKKSNEKREVIYTFRKFQPGDSTLVFDVAYSEKGKTTKMDDILKEIKKAEIKMDDETLTKAFRVFEKQCEVDFFINKDARAFLQEQFNLWMYQYLFDGQNVWSVERLAQLQVLKAIAYKVIDFISQFEDELVKIWNKPKFVRNSHYVLTLDKLVDSPVFEKILAHANLPKQVQEWHDLGMTDEDFQPAMLTQKDLVGELLYPQYKFLPIDTKYFTDLEIEILALFDDIDTALDGWLVHSENYQALNSLSKKYKYKIKCIYIDPPYNADGSEILYVNTYRSASWITIIENRINFVSNYLLTDESALVIAVDDFEMANVVELLKNKFPDYDVNVIVVNHHPQGSPKANLSRTHEYAILVTPKNTDFVRVPRKLDKSNERSFMRSGTARNNYRYGRPNSFYALLVDAKTGEIKGIEKPPDENDNDYPRDKTDEGYIRIYPFDGKNQERVWRKSYSSAVRAIRKGIVVGHLGKKGPTIMELVSIERVKATSNWFDSKYNAGTHGTALLTDYFNQSNTFAYPKSLNSVTDIVDAIVYDDNDAIVFDFFAGSGTTAHSVMMMNREDDENKRKYILVELGEHFNTVILPRIKKVAYSDQWKDGKANGGKGMSHFVKYYDLEQYEDVLRRVHYADADLFFNPYEDPYHSYVFLRDLKMLDSIEIDAEQNKAHFYPERLYPDIDMAETLSQCRGKWIKRITAEYVEFQDGERMSLTDPDWQAIKPLVWWQ